MSARATTAIRLNATPSPSPDFPDALGTCTSFPPLPQQFEEQLGISVRDSQEVFNWIAVQPWTCLIDEARERIGHEPHDLDLL